MPMVKIRQRSGSVLYLPKEIKCIPRSTLALFLISDCDGNEGYCCVVSDDAEKDSKNGIFHEVREFASLLLDSLDYDKSTVSFCDCNYNIEAYDDTQYIRRMNKEKEEIRNYLANDRKVESLIHFTPVGNLNGIAKEGIVPRSNLKPNTATCLDGLRLDGMMDCSCFTFSYPNYKMFYKYRNENKTTHFAVIEIDISVLETFDMRDMYFFYTNAAYYKFRDFSNKDKRTTKAVREMFRENNRAENLPINYTTDPQAEILIRGIIPTDYIKQVYIYSYFPECKNLIPKEFAGKTRINCDFFGPRIDFRQW